MRKCAETTDEEWRDAASTYRSGDADRFWQGGRRARSEEKANCRRWCIVKGSLPVLYRLTRAFFAERW